jgi:hypothetical protein
VKAPSSHTEETDGFDETLVPHDSGREPYPNLDITDNEINGFLKAISDVTPNVTFIFDSCYSGTATRAAGLARRVEDDTRERPERDDLPFALTRGAEGGDDLRAAGSQWALIAGCRADQVSRELSVDGRSYGAMSWFLGNGIRKAGAGATYRDVMDTVEVEVSSRYDQNPQLEGPGRDRLVFGTQSDVRPPHVLIETAEAASVTLGAGQVQGVTKGSVYDVYPPGTSDFSGRVAGRVEVTEADVTRAKAKILEGSAVPAGRAIERKHFYPDPVLRVHLMDVKSSATLGAIRRDLASLKQVAIDERGDRYDLLLREHQDPSSRRRFIVTEGGDPTEISPRVAADDPAAVSKVTQQIERWAKWFNILRIENAQPKLGLVFRLKVPSGAGREVAAFAGRQLSLTVTEGTKVAIEAENTSSTNLYLAVLDLSSDGSVSLVYPTGGQQTYVAPGKTWSLDVETFVPLGRDSVVDILKAFATTAPADFSFLEQAAVRGERGLPRLRNRSRNPLEELLGSAALVSSVRQVKAVATGDWATAEQALGVGRKK